MAVGELSGCVGSETGTATGAAANYSSANVGSYPGVDISYTLHNGSGGGLAGNYSLANGAASGQITPKALTVTGITANNKTYDATTTATLATGSAALVGNLDGGVYMSVGSAVMSPMIFEKSLSMSQNLLIQEGKHVDNHFMLVVDLAKSTWDWSGAGEPPMDNPAYYLRYCKTFSRMGGTMRYLSADNRDFLINLYGELN